MRISLPDRSCATLAWNEPGLFTVLEPDSHAHFWGRHVHSVASSGSPLIGWRPAAARWRAGLPGAAVRSGREPTTQIGQPRMGPSVPASAARPTAQLPGAGLRPDVGT